MGNSLHENHPEETSLVVQWLEIHLPVEVAGGGGEGADSIPGLGTGIPYAAEQLSLLTACRN